MNVSKIKPEEINLLLQVLGLPKEVVIYDPQNKIESENLLIIRDIASLLKGANNFRTCVNYSGERLEILSFDFILEMNSVKQDYKSFYREKFLAINNRDGSMRWFQSSHSKNADFLHLYSNTDLKATFFKMAMKIAFAAGLQNWISQGNFCLYSKMENYFKNQFKGQDVAVFTGTVGENRKAVAAICEEGTPSHFIKIPISKKAEQLIRLEHEHLESINQYNFEKMEVPDAKMKKVGLQLTNIQPKDVLSAISIEEVHLNALKELYDKTSQVKVLSDLPLFKEVEQRLIAVKNAKENSTGHISNRKVERLAYNLKVLLNNVEEGKLYPLAYAHGDFTPWNMFVSEDRVHVYDWELAMPEQMLLYDAFHFVFQSSILILHQPFSQIKSKISALENKSTTADIIERYGVDYWACYRWYLLNNCSYYLNLYLKQNHLHQQAHWLIDCWIDATSDAIKTTRQKQILVS